MVYIRILFVAFVVLYVIYYICVFCHLLGIFKMTDEEIFNNHTQWMIDNYGKHFMQFIINFHNYKKFKIKNNPKYHEFLRHNSYWYKELNRKSSNFLLFENDAKADAIKEGINNAKAEATEIINSAREQAKAIVDEANKNAKEKEEEMLENSRDEIVDLAIDASAALLKREFDDADNKRLIEDFLDSLKSNGDIDA